MSDNLTTERPPMPGAENPWVLQRYDQVMPYGFAAGYCEATGSDSMDVDVAYGIADGDGCASDLLYDIAGFDTPEEAMAYADASCAPVRSIEGELERFPGFAVVPNPRSPRFTLDAPLVACSTKTTVTWHDGTETASFDRAWSDVDTAPDEELAAFVDDLRRTPASGRRP